MTLRVVRNLTACLVLVLGGIIALAGPAEAVVHTGPATPFKLQANRTYCVGTDGNLVIIAKCNGSTNQAWYPTKPYLGDGSGDTMFQQRSSSRCLQVQTGSTYSLLITSGCTDQDARFTGAQTWFVYGGLGGANWANTEYYRSTHACMGVTSVSSGHAVQMVPCNASDNKQRWDKG